MSKYKRRVDLVRLFLAFGVILLLLIWGGVGFALKTAIGENQAAVLLLVLSGLVGSGLTIGGTALLLWQIKRQGNIEKSLLAHEADLISAREDLERSNDELKNFARVIAHDLQEPLRAIISYTQLLNLRYRGKLDEDADEFIGYLISGAANMKARLMDLLDYTTIDQHSRPPEPVPLDLVVKDLETYFAEDIEKVGAVIETGPLPVVLATHKRMNLIFEHLLTNAIEYREPSRPLKIGISAKSIGKDRWEISFTDNGIGIEPQYFERIFLIFQRLHSAADHSGTGVGLAICKKIVEQLGGSIRVESTFGQGTVFRFTLPAAISDKIEKT